MPAALTAALTSGCLATRWSISTPNGTDCHMHVNPTGEGIQYGADRVLGALEGAGLKRGCILSQGYQKPSGCSPPNCPSQHEWAKQRNDWTLEQARKSTDLISFCGVPIDAPWANEEIARCASNGARGLKLHPVAEGLSLLDPKIFAKAQSILDTAARLKLPVLIHIPYKSTEEVDAFFRLAASKPAATLIAAHQLGSNFKKLAEAPSNIYVDISGLVLAPRVAGPGFVAAWRAIGMERILLGSDWPLLHPSEHMAALRAFPLSRKEFELITERNARRLWP